MEIFNKIGQVLTADLTKDFKLTKKQNAISKESIFINQLKKRQSAYVLGSKIAFSQAYIAELVQESVKSCPVHYSQTSKVALLLGESHHQFWTMVKEVQKRNVPNMIFEAIDAKISQMEAGVGTVLFYEDQTVITQLKKNIPMHAENFDTWSEQASGMAQFAVWSALTDIGLGASLHHYDSSIQYAEEHLDIAQNWKIRAQLVFGSIEEFNAEVDQQEDHEKFRIYL
ncbi:hypothetical protein [Acinetobacter sp. ANC 3813]|uniref:hypothetical protein n=1 Tax=Acinetobacter sp. ANC 3813 TaxID=1977873 RepID=UPI000A33049E|nr:hypothetical protein [Acinetobacter sp. ANC 3813]OTG89377.1 hypothetical protein B9T34_11960 [Acinetobacter sp. ANC 3813]